MSRVDELATIKVPGRADEVVITTDGRYAVRANAVGTKLGLTEHGELRAVVDRQGDDESVQSALGRLLKNPLANLWFDTEGNAQLRTVAEREARVRYAFSIEHFQTFIRLPHGEGWIFHTAPTVGKHELCPRDRVTIFGREARVVATEYLEGGGLKVEVFEPKGGEVDPALQAD